MPQKKRTKKTTDSSKFFFKSLGDGISAIFKVTEGGGLDACQTTGRGGKLVKLYKWDNALPDGSIEPTDRVNIILLGEGFADVYAITPGGKISSRRVGVQDEKWVSAKNWLVVHNPEDAPPPRKNEDTPPPEPDAAPVDNTPETDPDPDTIRKEAMRKRGVMLKQHSTAGK